MLPHHPSWRVDSSDAVLKGFAAGVLRLDAAVVAGRFPSPPPGARAWFTPDAAALCLWAETGVGVEVTVVGSAAELDLTFKVQAPPAGNAPGAVSTHEVHVPRMWHGDRVVRCGPWPLGATVLLCTAAPTPLSVSPPQRWSAHLLGVVPAPGVPAGWRAGARDDEAVDYAARLCGIKRELVSAPSQAAAPPTLIVWDKGANVLLSLAQRRRVVVLAAVEPGIVAFTFCATGVQTCVMVEDTFEAQVHSGFDNDNPDGTSLIRDVLFTPDHVLHGRRLEVPKKPWAWTLADDESMAEEAERVSDMRWDKYRKAAREPAPDTPARRKLSRLKRRANAGVSSAKAIKGCSTYGGRLLRACLEQHVVARGACTPRPVAVDKAVAKARSEFAARLSPDTASGP